MRGKPAMTEEDTYQLFETGLLDIAEVVKNTIIGQEVKFVRHCGNVPLFLCSISDDEKEERKSLALFMIVLSKSLRGSYHCKCARLYKYAAENRRILGWGAKRLVLRLASLLDCFTCKDVRSAYHSGGCFRSFLSSMMTCLHAFAGCCQARLHELYILRTRRLCFPLSM